MACAVAGRNQQEKEETEVVKQSVKGFNAVPLEKIQKVWKELESEWKIPVEGVLMNYIQALCDLNLVERREIVFLQQNDKKGRKTNHKREIQLQVCVKFADVLNGLMGNSSENMTAEELDFAQHLPIVLALRGIKRRYYANMHKV